MLGANTAPRVSQEIGQRWAESFSMHMCNSGIHEQALSLSKDEDFLNKGFQY